MLAHTKKPRTEAVELRFLVRPEAAEEARRAMAPYLADGERTPWREEFPNFSPAVALRGARKREGLTQKALAERLGVRQAHLSQMENNKRPIGKAMAKRLAAELDVDYRVFL